MKIYYPARDRTPDLLNQRQTCYHLNQRGKQVRSRCRQMCPLFCSSKYGNPSFTSKPNARRTFWNLHIKILETNWPIKLEFSYAFYFKNLQVRYKNHKILAINMLIWEFSKTHSQSPVNYLMYCRSYFCIQQFFLINFHITFDIFIWYVNEF